MEWRSVLPIASAVVMLGSAKVPAFAAEFVSIRPLKLVIVDKLASSVSVIKPGKLLKNVARSLGDMPMDISSPPGGILHTEYSIRNGEEQIYLCGEFPSSACSHKSIAGGTGWKVLCKNGFEAMCRKDPCWWTPCGAFVD